jgi:hypothetical protein
VELGVLVTLWQEKIATKTPKHQDFTKTNKSKYLNLTALPVCDKTDNEFQQFYHPAKCGIPYGKFLNSF